MKLRFLPTRRDMETMLYCQVPAFTQVLYGCLAAREGFWVVRPLNWVAIALAWIGSGILLERRLLGAAVGLLAGLWLLFHSDIYGGDPARAMALFLEYLMQYGLASCHCLYRRKHPAPEEPEDFWTDDEEDWE